MCCERLTKTERARGATRGNNCTFGLRSRPFSVFLGRTIPVASFICFLLPALPLSGSARAALRLSLLRGYRSHCRARSGGGTKRQNQHYSPALDGFRRRHSRATQVSPLWRSLARCSSPSTLSASKEKRGGAPLTLVLARAGMLPVLKALSVLRTLSRPKATMLSERKRRRKGSRGGERSTASRVSFFLSFVQHEDFFFRPRFSTLFSNG